MEQPSRGPACAWGCKLESHHCLLNFTFVGGQVSVTPYLMGTDPAEYITTEYAGLRGAGIMAAQRTVLQHLLREYVLNLEYDKAVQEWEKIQKAGWNDVYIGRIGTAPKSTVTLIRNLRPDKKARIQLERTATSTRTATVHQPTYPGRCWATICQ